MVGTAVATGGNGAPVLESGKQVLLLRVSWEPLAAKGGLSTPLHGPEPRPSCRNPHGGRPALQGGGCPMNRLHHRAGEGLAGE